MDAFVEAFFAIDADHSETITADELKEYMLKNDMDPAFVQRWQEIFDPDQTGVISLQTFCDVLGLQVNDMRGRYELTETAVEPEPEPEPELDYEEITADVSDELRKSILSYTKEGLKLYDQDDENLAKWLKKRMDSLHGRLWHCMIIRGQYFSYYSYQPGNSFCFRVGKQVFVLFKTPCH